MWDTKTLGMRQVSGGAGPSLDLMHFVICVIHVFVCFLFKITFVKKKITFVFENAVDFYIFKNHYHCTTATHDE